MPKTTSAKTSPASSPAKVINKSITKTVPKKGTVVKNVHGLPVKFSYEKNGKLVCEGIDGYDHQSALECYSLFDEQISLEYKDNEDFVEAWNDNMMLSGVPLFYSITCDYCDKSCYACYHQEGSNQPAYDNHDFYATHCGLTLCPYCTCEYVRQCSECSECEVRSWRDSCSFCGYKEDSEG